MRKALLTTILALFVATMVTACTKDAPTVRETTTTNTETPKQEPPSTASQTAGVEPAAPIKPAATPEPAASPEPAATKDQEPPVEEVQPSAHQAPPEPELVGDEISFAVAQTNDLHGFILPQKYASTRLMADGSGVVTVGGFDWLAGYVDILKRQFDNRVLLVDAGDMFQGHMLSNVFEGATVVKAMNRLGYRSTTLGNHEFDFGAVGDAPDDTNDPFGALKARASEAKFPFLACNVYDRATGEPVAWKGFEPYTMLELAGVKFAIIGATTPETVSITPDYVDKNLEFRPMAPEILKNLKKVKEEGAQVVIVVVHAGSRCRDWSDPRDISSCDTRQELLVLAKDLKGQPVDLLIGGHTHSIVAHYVNGIPVLESAANGRYLGLAALEFSPSAKRVTRTTVYPPIPICHKQYEGTGSCTWEPDDPSLKLVPATFMGALVKPIPFLEEMLSPKERQVLVDAQEELGPVVVRNMIAGPDGLNPVGNLITYMLRQTYPNADLAIFNSSGIRAGLLKGKVTVEDVYRILPFDSPAALITLTGAQLLEMLRLATSGAHSLPVLRGVDVTIDLTKDPCIEEDRNGDGKREEWERNLLLSVTLGGVEEIRPGATYTVVTSAYLAKGGSSFSHVTDTLPEGAVVIPDPRPLRELFMDWLRGYKKPIGTPQDSVVYAIHSLNVINPDHIPGSTCPTTAPSSPDSPAPR